MPELLRSRDCILVTGEDKGYIEFLNKNTYVAVLFIVGWTTDILPDNQFCQVPIVEGNGLQYGHLRNIYSAPNQHTLLRISSQRTQHEE